MRRLAGIAATIAVVGAFSLMLVEPFNARALDVGQPAPDFKLLAIDGSPIALSDFRGKTVVLEWFNRGCPFVQKHYKDGDMQALQSQYKAKGVVWLIVNSTATSSPDYLSPEKTREVIDEWKIADATYMIDASGTVGRSYGAKTTPHMYVIDPSGTLAYAGAIDDDEDVFADPKKSKNYVRAALDDILANRPVATKSSKPYGCSVKY